MEQTEQPQAGSEQPSIEDRIADKLYGPSEEPEVETTEQPAESAAVEEGQPQEAPAAPALEEVEWEGEKFQLPAKIKSALMAQSDYTVKTQEVAEQRRMLDLRVQSMQLDQQFQQSVSQEVSQLNALDFQISQFNNVNWGALDTDSMMRAKHQLDTLKEQKQAVVQQIQGKRQEYDGKIQNVTREAQKKGEEFLRKAIPSWGPEVQKEIASYGTNEGYSDVELSSLNDPRMVKTLWKASQWDKLQSTKGKTLQKAAEAPPVVKPGASTQQTAKANSENAYRKALREAKTPAERTRIIQDRVAQKFGG
jgi:hypothetical protein